MDRDKKIFENFQQEFAVTAKDEEIYPRLPCFSKARDIGGSSKDSEAWLDIGVIPEQYHPAYTKRPQQLPFTLQDVEDFASDGLPVGKRLSVRWATKDKKYDLTYDDGFRSVYMFRTIEFMIRPLPGQEGTGPGRI